MLERLSLRIRLLLFFAAVAVGSLLSVALGLWYAARHAAGPGGGLLTAGVIAGFAILGVTVAVWYLFDAHVGRALARLAAGMRAQAHAGGTGRFDAAPGRYLGDLGPAALALSDALDSTRAALAEAGARATQQLEAQKTQLEALLSDVFAGVLLCSPGHNLVFYNGPAVDLLGAGSAPGLDRPVFDYLRRAPLEHAHARLKTAGTDDAVSDLMVATADGGRMLTGRMRLVGTDGGYVLTLRDVTADLAAHAGQDRLLEDIFDGIRRPAANLSTMIGAMSEEGGAADLGDALVQEADTLARTVNRLGARYDADRGSWSPLPVTRAEDLIDGLRARCDAAGLPLDARADPLFLRGDGFELVTLIAGWAERLAAAGHGRAFTFAIEPDGTGAMLSLGWEGTALPISVLESWLGAPIDPAVPDVNGRAVLAGHATECWPESAGARQVIRLPIRAARPATRIPAPVTRQVTYDFDLMFKAETAALAQTPLDRLTYVVFDTETTGLLPEAGDEIVQIAGLRLVNGRRVAGELFDMLADPGRPIPAQATVVHGITEAMVAGAPGVAEVVRRFHRFAAGAVLIAHNAPFDMAFLRRRETETGLRFDHPILDTVLLSAVVYGRTESHSLDALSQRLGITIPEAARHTAIGDAEATAEAFLKLVPMLRGRGIVTFGDVLHEVRKHGRLLRDLNA